MFNQKKIEELKHELKTERAYREILQKRFDLLLSEIRLTNSNIERIGNKIEPKPIPKYDLSAIEFAKGLQRFPKKQQCGGGRACQKYYMIPCSEIDGVAKA